MVDIEQLKKHRTDFLVKLYELSKGDIYASISMWELGASMNLERESISPIVEYLIGEGFIKAAGLGGFISITHNGIKESENILNPTKTQKLDRPINIIKVENMTNSQIQQASSNSQQVYVATPDEQKVKGRIAGIVSLVVCIITGIMIFNFGWDLSGQVLTVISALFGILGVGSLISPAHIGKITIQLLHNIGKNYDDEESSRAKRRDVEEIRANEEMAHTAETLNHPEVAKFYKGKAKIIKDTMNR